ncbi:hypothetical protein L1887_18169 [Cichorium endivia]|nr:hypothetical protein L1887_18169 [Cichorium endivia]
MVMYGVKMMSLVVILSCTTFISAKVYEVGDSGSWALSVDYSAWTSDKTFLVGDTLVFNYDSSHTVDEVSKSDYTTCTIGNPIASYESGNTTVTLKNTGSHYFICGIVGHCSAGMKLTVDVTGADSSSMESSSSARAGT